LADSAINEDVSHKQI